MCSLIRTFEPLDSALGTEAHLNLGYPRQLTHCWPLIVKNRLRLLPEYHKMSPGKRNTPTLLVGVQISAATLENSLEVP